MLKVKIGRKTSTERNRSVEGAVTAFCETKAKIDELDEQLKKHKTLIVDEAKNILGDDDVSTITFSVGEDSVKISFGFDIKVTDDTTLKEILGDRFEDLVTVKTDYKPVNKLKEMALEDDGLKSCLAVKEKTPTVAVVK